MAFRDQVRAKPLERFVSYRAETLPLDYINMFEHPYVYKNEIHRLDLAMTTTTDTRLATDLETVQCDFEGKRLYQQTAEAPQCPAGMVLVKAV